MRILKHWCGSYRAFKTGGCVGGAVRVLSSLFTVRLCVSSADKTRKCILQKEVKHAYDTLSGPYATYYEARKTAADGQNQ